MTDAGLALSVLPERLAIARLEPSQPIPAWAQGGFVAIVRTRDELSVVCAADLIPPGVAAQDGWRCLQVIGPLDLGLTGVLASMVAPLAAAKLSVFAVSTYDTDYLLVREEALEAALETLRAAGHVTPDLPAVTGASGTVSRTRSSTRGSPP
jgi:uncharacterized protein